MTNANWRNYFLRGIAKSEINGLDIIGVLTQSQICDGVSFRLAKIGGGVYLVETVSIIRYFRLCRSI